MKEILKGIYKRGIRLWLCTARKMLIGYHPILLEYPHNPKHRYGWGKPPHPVLYDILNKERERYSNILKSFLPFKESFQAIALSETMSSEEPDFYNSFLPPLDSLALYAIISLEKPKRYFEIGSGNSTKFAKRAIRDLELETGITSIDPHPLTEINSICDCVIRQRVEELDLTVFDELESGDILYIDGSHYCFQNSDVTVVFLDILPRLKAGVIVQIHDVFLPYDYPPIWKERHFSEQYLLAVSLLVNDKHYTIMLPNRFITEDAELLSILDPFWVHPKLEKVVPHGGSFWMKVN